MKTCTKCGLEFPATAEYFHRNKDKRNGLSERCKSCRCEAARQHYEQNANRIRERVHLYQQQNRDKELERCRRYREQNKEKRSAYHRRWCEQNPEKKRKSYRQWRQKNTKKYREYQRQYNMQPKQRLRQAISGGVRKSIKSGKNGRSWESLVGYTIKELKAHLELQFRRGMTWDNYGSKWHIDHIRPVSSFSFSSPGDPEFKECWSLWNLQPMWAKKNISKGAKCKKPPLPLLSEGSEA